MSRLPTLALLAVLGLNSTADAQGIRKRQASYPDSLVTFRAFTKACRLSTGILDAIATAAQENLSLARDTLAKQPGNARLVVERDERLADSVAAEAQLTRWKQTMSEARRARLKAYCDLEDLEVAAKLTGMPGRDDVIKAAAVSITYNPDNVPLGVGPAGFLSFLGIDQGALVSGLTQFLVDRAAAEVQLAFVNRVKERVCRPTLSMAFGATCLILEQDHLSLHSSVLRELRAAAEQDLKHLPHTGPLAVIASTRFKESLFKPDSQFTRDRQDLVLAGYFVGSFADRLIGGEGALQVLSGLAKADSTILDSAESTGLLTDALSVDTVEVSLPVSAALYRLALVGGMLPDNDGDGTADWPGDTVAFAKAVGVNLMAWLPELDIARTTTIDSVLGFAGGVANALNASKQQFDSLRVRLRSASGAGTLALADYSAMFDDALAIADHWARLFVTLRGRESTIPTAIKDLRTVANGLSRRDYSAAVLGFYALVNHVGEKDFELPEGLAKTISFTTAVAQAGSSKEVASVIESYAAPVASYRVKRRAERLYVVVNGYLGGSGGWERSASRTAKYVGVSAPIGIEVGWSPRPGWSLGFLAQILDLGTPASYRMTKSDEELEREPEVGFAQVFSPGGYFVLGIPNFPLAFGAGANVAPSLRKTSSTNGETRNATRWGFFLSVDMPLLHLH